MVEYITFFVRKYAERNLVLLTDIFRFQFEQTAIVTDLLGCKVLLQKCIALENRLKAQMRDLPGLGSALLVRMEFW